MRIDTQSTEADSQFNITNINNQARQMMAEATWKAMRCLALEYPNTSERERRNIIHSYVDDALFGKPAMLVSQRSTQCCSRCTITESTTLYKLSFDCDHSTCYYCAKLMLLQGYPASAFTFCKHCQHSYKFLENMSGTTLTWNVNVMKQQSRADHGMSSLDDLPRTNLPARFDLVASAVAQMARRIREPL